MLNFQAENKQENEFPAILAVGMLGKFQLQVLQKQLN